MEKGIQNSDGARPVNQDIKSMWQTRTSRLSIKISLSARPPFETSHARVLEGVAESQSPLKAVVFKNQQPCPSTVALDLDPSLGGVQLDSTLT